MTATRWNDTTCGIPGCPCPHEPDGYPSGCDRGWTTAGPATTTPGARGVGGTAVTDPATPNRAGALPGDGPTARCRRCRDHAKRRATRTDQGETR